MSEGDCKMSETLSAQATVTIRDRLEVGNLSVDEVCALKQRSRSGFYADVRAGLVEIREQGRKSVIPGPAAKRYIDATALPLYAG
jgi:hypothetical protein